jgi:hypothetical protein
MKHIHTFEGFLNEKLGNTGVLDTNWVWGTVEDAEMAAYMKYKKIKDRNEADTQWNSDLDDSKSELSIALDSREDPYNAANKIDVDDPASVRNFITVMEKGYTSKKTILSDTPNTVEFKEVKKALTIYADNLEKMTPLVAAEIILSNPEFIKSKGIRAKEYFEAGYSYVRFDIEIKLNDGKVLARKSRDFVGVRGDDLNKLTAFIKNINQSIEKAGFVYQDPYLDVITDFGKPLKDIEQAKKNVKTELPKLLKPLFPDAKVKFDF